MRRWILCLLLAATVGSAPASGALLFSDTFDAEAQGLNQALDNWTVSDGAIDVVGPGFFDFYPGNGNHIDLDGSIGDAGRITTNTVFDLDPGTTYVLRFELGGSARGDTNSVTVSLGSFSEVFTMTSSEPLAAIVREITVAAPTSSALVFDHAGGDHLGLLLDDVTLNSRLPVGGPSGTPAPGILALLGVGLALIGNSRRRHPR